MRKFYFAILIATAFCGNIQAEHVITAIQHTNHRNPSGNQQMSIEYDAEGHITRTVSQRQDGLTFTTDYTYDLANHRIAVLSSVTGEEEEALPFTCLLDEGRISKYLLEYGGESFTWAEFTYDNEGRCVKAFDYTDGDESIVEYTWSGGDMVSHTESWDGAVKWWNNFTYTDIAGESILSHLIMFGGNLDDSFMGLIPYTGFSPRHMVAHRTEGGVDTGSYSYDYVLNAQQNITSIKVTKNGVLSDTYFIEWTDRQFASVASMTASIRQSSACYSLGGYRVNDKHKGIVIRSGKKIRN